MSGRTSILDPLSSDAAQVTKQNRLKTASSSQSQSIVQALNGETFIITTGSVNVTDAALSYLLYVKNSEQTNWVIEFIGGTFGATDGTGDGFVRFAIGPTAGTLVTAGTDFVPANLNFGSPTRLTGVFKIGATGSTITDGFVADPTLIPEGLATRIFPARPLIIAPGSSFAIGFQPPTGNTSMNIQLQVPVYREVVE